jgi:hypothetical protein
MPKKKQFISDLKEKPDCLDAVQRYDRLLLIKKIEEGRNQIKAGKGLSMCEAKKKIRQY